MFSPNSQLALLYTTCRTKFHYTINHPFFIRSLIDQAMLKRRVKLARTVV